MATTFTTASPMAAVTAALLLAVAISSPTAVFADKSSESSEGADSKENRSSVSARQLFGFGPGRPGLPGLFGSSPFGFGNNGFPFGGGNPFFNGLPGGGGGSGQFNNNPFLNGQTGNAPFNNNNNPSISGDPSGNPYPTNVPTSGGSGGPVRPRPDQTGNQYNTGRPFGSGGVQNGNQYTTSRPFGSGGAQNDNQYNTGRPFGSGDVQNGNQYTTSRPFGSAGGGAQNDNQYNSGRPFGSGDVQNGNQYTTSRPFGSGGVQNGNQYNTDRPFGNGEVQNGNQFTTSRPSGNGEALSGNPFSTGLPFSSGPARPGGQRPNQPQGTTPRPVGAGGAGERDLLVNPEGCGIRSDDRIIGGNTTYVMELPWMVRLGYTGRRGISYRCGGSLVNHRYVLTAAHCVAGDAPVQVRLGEHDEDSDRDCSIIAGTTICAPPVVDVPIERVIQHPQYSSDSKSPNYLKNDVALLRLRTPVTFTEAVKPICLPQTGGAQVAPGKRAVVAGWGKDRNRGSTGTRLLMSASVPLWTVPDCARVYQSRGVQVGASQLCAGGTRGVDSCQGDSGGPLYRAGLVHDQPRAVQVGIVSFGLSECATEGVPGVYTRVESFMPWIVSNMV
ncbi:melanization protease 1-like [Frankliniella occidentalis]|uniref:limulus clotting factor C n=1 Tax=Frankliniella occidentalis TaxID=133901 RepID=A0A9C6WX98_FRAOC|nr:melanization protease 1-like [Frankliniella occidentalis]